MLCSQSLPDGRYFLGMSSGAFAVQHGAEGVDLEPVEFGYQIRALLSQRPGECWAGTSHEGLLLMEVRQLMGLGASDSNAPKAVDVVIQLDSRCVLVASCARNEAALITQGPGQAGGLERAGARAWRCTLPDPFGLPLPVRPEDA